VAPWLLTIVRNRAIDNARREHAHVTRRADEERLHAIAAPDSVAEQVIAEDIARHVMAVLADLPDEQREAIDLAFNSQLTHTEIAARLQLPLGTVKGRIRLGMERLQGELTHGVC
jgi:RNA polymerase sigma-70 factor (ECF subfamily)